MVQVEFQPSSHFDILHCPIAVGEVTVILERVFHALKLPDILYTNQSSDSVFFGFLIEFSV